MALHENRIKTIARQNGAAMVGIASRQRLDDAPPSGNPNYLLASTRSVISFALPFDRKAMQNYFAKKDWLSHGADQKHLLQSLYRINDRLKEYLKGQGHEAIGVDGNCVFRPEPGARHTTDMTEFYPDFSHRYGALAAGLGRLGWSGNLLTPEFGASVLLGTVLTSAELTPDPLCDHNPCDRCKLCTLVCPVEMIDKSGTAKVTVAGITEEIAEKKPNTCCWIGCGDYHGLGPDKKWSNWSPYRVDYPLPGNKSEVDALLVRLRKADPQLYLEPSQYTDYRATAFDQNWIFSNTCGNCAHICWEKRTDRKENRRMIVNSGVVVLNPDGTRQAVKAETVELPTRYGSRVAVSKQIYERLTISVKTNPPTRAMIDKDADVAASVFFNKTKS